MSDPHPRHAAPDVTTGNDDAFADRPIPRPGWPRRPGLANPRATRTVWFWTVPIVVTLAVLSALAAFYLGGILRPMTNLRHFPIAVLNEDAGPTGAQVVKGMLAGFDNDAYDVRPTRKARWRRGASTARSSSSRRIHEPARWAPASPARHFNAPSQWSIILWVNGFRKRSRNKPAERPRPARWR
jgi:hypothetical protein